MVEWIASVAIVAGYLLVAALVWSIAFPRLSVWPRPDAPGDALRARRVLNRVVGAASSAVLLAAVFVAVATRVPAPSGQIAAGGLLFVAGGFLGLAGYFSLGAAASFGEHVPLVATGVYRYSRNPQYVGAVGALVGAVVASGSSWAAWVAAPSALWFLLAPFAEEAWLHGSLGEPYRAYLRSAPRYLGWPKPPSASG